jgi:5'/3'-nucleotidase
VISRTRTVLSAVVLVVCGALAAGACSSDDNGDDAKATTTTAATKATTTSTTEAAKKLKILVSNDDGYSAEGIDAVVEGLRKLPDVEVEVVAPASQQSGTGGKTTPGTLTATDSTTKSGYKATAVKGYPADSVNYAFDTLKVKPQLVVTGINLGQNLGPVADLSGTVGAARAGVAHGVPALASSQGIGKTLDYPTGAEYVTKWVEDNRAALLDGTAKVQVSNMNIPSCPSGTVHGLKEVPPGTDGANAIKPQDCTSTATPENNDVSAFNLGWVTLSALPDKPATTTTAAAG